MLQQRAARGLKRMISAVISMCFISTGNFSVLLLSFLLAISSYTDGGKFSYRWTRGFHSNEVSLSQTRQQKLRNDPHCRGQGRRGHMSRL